jgi:hypothetical protein
MKKNIENIEAIGVERDLAGLPMAMVPAELLSKNASNDQKALLSEIKNIVINVRRDDVETLLVQVEGSDPDIGPEASAAWERLALVARGTRPAAATDEAPLPDGEWARVEVMGHDEHTGWVTDGTRAGVPVLVIKDWDGRTIAEIPGGSLYRFVPLPTPLKRPEPRPALPVRTYGYATDDDYDEPGDGADHDASDDYSEGGPF